MSFQAIQHSILVTIKLDLGYQIVLLNWREPLTTRSCSYCIPSLIKLGKGGAVRNPLDLGGGPLPPLRASVYFSKFKVL